MNWLSLRSARSSKAASRSCKRSRKMAVEPLEGRSLLASLPYGAMADDTGEFMLGDVLVTVVLMESNPTLSPHDNGTVTIGGQPRNYVPENWTAGAIADVKSRVQAGMQWWSDVLDAMPNVRDGLLNFKFDWTYADSPVQTGYEPIARISNDFNLWIYDFLHGAGFSQTGNFSSDIRAFNNFQRQQHETDWAFTIFVVNDDADPDNEFAQPGGSFSRAFAYAGGRFMVVPASRPASTFAHEAGHMFWALDEYIGGASYLAKRGYYNTQNVNGMDNPDVGFEHANSIMSKDGYLEAAYAAMTSSTSSLEMIGWKDSDGDGIFDVLDVPFDLTGKGNYSESSGIYTFSGNSKVRTLPNRNTSGLQNDITINKIRLAEYSIDGGPWQAAASYDAHETAVNLSFPVPSGDHEIRIRTVDTRTGVTSVEFIGTTSQPSSQMVSSGVGGYLYRDDNNSGTWDQGEVPLVDWAIELVDDNGNLIQLRRNLEPDAFTGVISGQIQGVTITAIGGDIQNPQVRSQPSIRVPAAGNVLWANSIVNGGPVETWTSSSRRLKLEFATAQTVVNVMAMGSGGTSIGRLEAYNSSGQLIARYTTKTLGLGQSEMMSIARPQGDIAYVVAGGHVGTEVLLDFAQWGPKAVVTTDIHGAYVLPDLPGGSYHIRVIAPPNFLPTSANGNEAEIVLNSGAALADLNFGFRSPGSAWQNSAKPLDVDGDGTVAPLDALIIINRLNSASAPQLPGTRGPNDMFYDVDADLYVTALDALIVINYLNSPSYAANGEGELPAAGSTTNFRPSSGSGQAEGEETLVAPPVDAADYYSRQPFHVLDLPGDDEPCTCHSCTGAAIESLVAETSAGLLAAQDGETFVAEAVTRLESHFGDLDAAVKSAAGDILVGRKEIGPLSLAQLLSARRPALSALASVLDRRSVACPLPDQNESSDEADVSETPAVVSTEPASLRGAALKAWTLLRSRLRNT
jgi:hypothetical protein